MAQRNWQIVSATLVGALCLVVVACAKPEPTPTPAPFPTALPSPTPPAHQIVDGTRYIVSINGVDVATEELHASTSGDEVILTSELRYLDAPNTVERRTLVVSSGMSPMRYELERVTSGVRSLWVADRTTRGTSVLNNYQAWPGPIAYESVSPAADLMLEAAPSALPHVLLALRSRSLSQAQPSIALHTIDVCEDLPQSRVLTLSSAPGRTGAVIGTTAIEAEMEDGPIASLALWVRAGSSELYGAEIADFQTDYWLARTQPSLAGPGRLEFKRVAELPEILIVSEPAGQAITFEAPDGKTLQAWVSLVEGDGSHPCLISLGGGDVVSARYLSEAWPERDWATCVLDPRGTGNSEGTYQRGNLGQRASDAVALAQALGMRPDIDETGLVLMGANDAGLAAALALEMDGSLAGAVLISTACHEPLLPDLATSLALGPLAEARGWNPDDAEAFRLASADQWQRWLFEGEDEVALVGRRVPLNALRDYAETAILGAIENSHQPLLLLVGENATWPTADAQTAYAQRLAENGRGNVMVAAIAGEGDLLWESADGILVDAARETIASWLQDVRP